MNIFATSKDPKIAAFDHCDKHATKMLLETAQLLCTAHHLEGEASDIPNIYRVTHKNHPSAVWVRSSRANYLWAYDLFVALCSEFRVRFGKIHLTDDKLRVSLMRVPRYITDRDLTPPPACCPEEFHVHAEGEWPTETYKLYLSRGKDWITYDSWRRRPGPPAWYGQLEDKSCAI